MGWLFGGDEAQEFVDACRNGDVGSVQQLAASSDDIPALLSFDNYCCFREAASQGQLDVVEELIRLASECGGTLLDMLRANECEAFRHAAAAGHAKVVDRLLRTAQAWDRGMI